jgi:hypothetical protein
MDSPHFNLRTPLSRRFCLRAAGATLALPFLESMLPRLGAAAAAPESPRRFVGMMTNMGIMPEFFFPTTAGRDYESSPYLDLLKEHRADTTVFSGVSLPGVDGGHASEKSFLTGAPGASRGSFRNSISLDQAMAEKIGGETRLASLAIMIGSENLSLSWTRSGSMIPPVISPVKLYEQLFVEDTPAAQTMASQRLKEDRSLLDNLSEKARRLERKVGAADRDRLDQYFTSVRELEQRLATAEGWLGKPKPKVSAEKPQEINDRNDLPTNNRVMLDLVRLALETDSTRIVTVAASTGSITPRSIPGVKTSTHELTHHGRREEKVNELRLIEEAQFRDLSAFLAGLRSVSEQGSTLLDRTSVLYGTNMGSANAHSTDNLPALLFGGGFKQGHHLAFDTKKNYPLTNLHVSLLQRLGIEADRFSSGTTTMRGLEMT